MFPIDRKTAEAFKIIFLVSYLSIVIVTFKYHISDLFLFRGRKINEK